MNSKVSIIALLLFIGYITTGAAQQNDYTQDSVQIKNLYSQALLEGESYNWLEHLSNNIGGRLSGSNNAKRAVEYTKEELEKMGLDKVWLQEVMVPKWTRGAKETAYVEINTGERKTVNITALGGSISTPANGTKANVIEVKSLAELEQLGTENIKGKIVFFNRAMQADLINTFQSYGGCADQRYSGAAEAAKYGAVGVIVRSLNLRLDDYPHTGSMTYANLTPAQRIPAAAISTNDAEYLSGMLRLEKNLNFYFKLNSTQHEDVVSHNVIGEITGSEFPNEIIVVGGHLDSWDLGDGAHDDGAGVVQSMEVLRLFNETGIKPKRTIRVVLFMNEENGLRGANKYAEIAKKNNEKHIFALESDAGGFTPRGFQFEAHPSQFEQIESWKSLFKPYLIHYFELGGSGADVGPLRGGDVVLAGLRPDSQRYFDHHHAENDTFEHVNKRELELGGASMAALIYLIDKYGIKTISGEPAPKF